MRIKVIEFLVFTLLMMGIVLGSAFVLAHWGHFKLALGFGEWFMLIVISAGHGHLWVNRANVRSRSNTQSKKQ